MQMRYTHVLGLVSLQHQFVSQSQAQKPKIAFLFIARNRLPLEMVWDAFFRVHSFFQLLILLISMSFIYVFAILRVRMPKCVWNW